jgi:hypothetical protein
MGTDSCRNATLASTRQSDKVFVKALFSGAGFAMSFWCERGIMGHDLK